MTSTLFYDKRDRLSFLIPLCKKNLTFFRVSPLEARGNRIDRARPIFVNRYSVSTKDDI
ncbi:MAG: hypothetical protein ACRCT1_05810 [Microcoleaceae cyanobacterium]